MIFDFQLLEIMQINFNGVDLAFRCCMFAFEWEEFGFESFWNGISMCVYTHTHTNIYNTHTQTNKTNVHIIASEGYG